jgi:hypothetical protein
VSFPEESYWLIDVLYLGFAEDDEGDQQYVRIGSTFIGRCSAKSVASIQIRTNCRDIHTFGRHGIGTRLATQYDRGVIYTPNAMTP